MARGYFTTNDIAQICKVTRQTVINWIKSGNLQAVQTPGGHRRVSREELLRFLEEKGLAPELVEEFESRKKTRLPYCWEYFSTGFPSRRSRHQCDRCVVKEVKALRCYILKNRFPIEGETCDTHCRECPYLKKYGAILGWTPSD